MPRKDRRARNQYIREHRKLNRERYNAINNKSIQKSFRSFITYRLKSIRTLDKRIGQVPDIDVDYMMGLLDQQGGRCAISGHLLTHQQNDIYSLSIDRIDSSIGHVKGNVQLVCLIMQYAKNKFDGELVKKFIQTIPGAQCA